MKTYLEEQCYCNDKKVPGGGPCPCWCHTPEAKKQCAGGATSFMATKGKGGFAPREIPTPGELVRIGADCLMVDKVFAPEPGVVHVILMTLVGEKQIRSPELTAILLSVELRSIGIGWEAILTLDGYVSNGYYAYRVRWDRDTWSFSPNVGWTMKKRSITLGDVVKDVEVERVYAALKWPTPEDESIQESHAFGEWLLYAKRYVDKAIEAAATSPGNAAARAQIIKAISLLAWAAQHPTSKSVDHAGASYHVKSEP